MTEATSAPPGSFDRALKAAGRRDRAALEAAAEQLVSSALVLPALSLARQASQRAAGPFAPGAAERRFGPLLDQQFADRMTRATRFGLVRTIVERYRWPMGNGQWAMGNGQWAMGNGQWGGGSDPIAYCLSPIPCLPGADHA